MLKPIYAVAPISGYEISVEDAKTDHEAYKILVSTGAAITAEQTQRYAELKAIFEPSV